MPEPVKLVCKDCGVPASFREHGTTRVSAWCDTRSITMGADGKVAVKWGSADTDAFGVDGFDPDYVECRSCGAEGSRVEDLVVPEHTYAGGLEEVQPGDIVILPDGLRAVVNEVDHEEHAFTVAGWHETFKPSEVAPYAPEVSRAA